MKKLRHLFGGIVVIMLLLVTLSCKTNKDKKDFNCPPEYNLIDDTINIALRNQVDSLMELELTYVKNADEMSAELNKLQHAFDSIEQSNLNLRNYIKHQDKMIKK